MKLKRNEYLQLVGLLALAPQHNKALDDIKKAIMKLVGETDEHGHVSDAIYCDYDADELLKKLEASRKVDAKQKKVKK